MNILLYFSNENNSNSELESQSESILLAALPDTALACSEFLLDFPYLLQ